MNSQNYYFLSFYSSFNCIQDMTTRFNKSLNFRKCQPTISENLSYEQLSLQNLHRKFVSSISNHAACSAKLSLFSSSTQQRISMNHCRSLYFACVSCNCIYTRKTKINIYILFFSSKETNLKYLSLEKLLCSLGIKKNSIPCFSIHNHCPFFVVFF